MHYLHSSIMSWKFIIKFLNKFICCICIKSFSVFLYFLQIIVRKRKYLKSYTLVFIKMNNEDLQHWYYSTSVISICGKQPKVSGGFQITVLEAHLSFLKSTKPKGHFRIFVSVGGRTQQGRFLLILIKILVNPVIVWYYANLVVTTNAKVSDKFLHQV